MSISDEKPGIWLLGGCVVMFCDQNSITVDLKFLVFDLVDDDHKLLVIGFSNRRNHV